MAPAYIGVSWLQSCPFRLGKPELEGSPSSNGKATSRRLSLKVSLDPRGYLGVYGGNQIVETPDEKAWLLTSADISGESGSAFSWNQWELDSLAAADGDEELRTEIRTFWDDHCSLMFCLKSGYSFDEQLIGCTLTTFACPATVLTGASRDDNWLVVLNFISHQLAQTLTQHISITLWYSLIIIGIC